MAPKRGDTPKASQHGDTLKCLRCARAPLSMADMSVRTRILYCTDSLAPPEGAWFLFPPAAYRLRGSKRLFLAGTLPRALRPRQLVQGWHWHQGTRPVLQQRRPRNRAESALEANAVITDTIHPATNCIFFWGARSHTCQSAPTPVAARDRVGHERGPHQGWCATGGPPPTALRNPEPEPTVPALATDTNANPRHG